MVIKFVLILLSLIVNSFILGMEHGWSIENSKKLFKAIEKGNVNKVRNTLNKLECYGIRLKNVNDENGNSPLHSASEKGEAEIVRILLDYGADAKATNAIGLLPAELATSSAIRDLLSPANDENSCKKSSGYFEDLHGCANETEFSVDSNLLLGFLASIRSHNKMNIDVPLLLSPPDKDHIARGALVNITDGLGNHLIHMAAYKGNFDLVKSLFSKGTDLSTRDRCGSMPLHLAVMGGHEDLARWLIEQNGEVINEKDDGGKTPLYYAALKGFPAIAEYLIANGALVDIPDTKGEQPLHIAVYNGNLQVIEILIGNGGDVNAPTNENLRPIDIIQRRQFLARWAASFGNTPDDRSNGLTGWLVKNGIIVDHKVKADIENLIDLTLLPNAQQQAIMELLISHGATINGEIFTYFNDRAMLEWLISHGLNIQAPVTINEAAGETISSMHCAACFGQPSLVDFLADRGIDTNTLDSQNLAPLVLAVGHGHLATVQRLIQRGANITIVCPNKNKRQLVHLAARRGHQNIIEYFTQNHNININTRDGNEMQPLHHAAEEGHQALVEWLIDHGAEVNARDAQGRTPLDLARLPSGISDDHQVRERREELAYLLHLKGARQGRAERCILF